LGAYVVDGKMIDPPFVERARVLVRHAMQLGLLTSGQSAVLDDAGHSH
jgi:citrate lyase subunit beta/citryl-CoA lyase